MTMLASRYNSYPAYRPSGVEWLGEIPAHWEVQPIRSFARSGYKKFTDGDWIESPYIRDVGVRLIQTGNIGVGNYKEQGFRYIAAETFDSFRCTEVVPGDVLICRLADPVGRACLAPALGCRMITSVDVCILKAGEDTNPAFVVYTLSGDSYLAWLSGICRGGTRDRVSRSMLGAIRVAKPPLAEQRAIAGVLDRETAKIDSLVAKKERLIELLQEKRIALIGRAVTKGLDPKVPMKDSGVEWLGEIPAHWQVKRLKHLLRAPLQYGANEPSNHIDPDSPRYIRITDIREDGTLWDDTFRSIPQETAKPYLLAEGDLLFARSGATVGKTFKYHPNWGKAAYAGYLIRARLDEVLTDADYLEYFTHSQAYKDWILGTLIQSTIQNVSAERYASLAVPLPSLGEQQAISKHLDSETAKIDALVKKVCEAIDRLTELRTALISAAVTGRIDVREEATFS